MVADSVIQNSANTTKPLFDFSDPLPGVSIIDNSAVTLVINKIDVVGPAGALPQVQLITKAQHDVVDNATTTTPYTLQFNLQRSVDPSFVDIQKLPPDGTGKPKAAIVLKGLINNPAGWTHVLNTYGDILSKTIAQDIVTTTLDIAATNGMVRSPDGT